MILLHHIKSIVLSLLIIIVLFGCTNKPRDQWSVFMGDVLTAAKEKDYERMVEKLTLYKVAEGKELLKRMAEADPEIEIVQNPNEPTDEQGYAAMLEDVKMFVRSYEDLFDGQLARYSARRQDVKGVELYSIILWVKKEQTYKGILIHQVWKRPNGFKVVEWVETSPSYATSGTLWKSRAKLEAKDAQSCIFPARIEYENIYQ